MKPFRFFVQYVIELIYLLSLSIARAKVGTFFETAKHFENFFSKNFSGVNILYFSSLWEIFDLRQVFCLSKPNTLPDTQNSLRKAENRLKIDYPIFCCMVCFSLQASVPNYTLFRHPIFFLSLYLLGIRFFVYLTYIGKSNT